VLVAVCLDTRSAFSV